MNKDLKFINEHIQNRISFDDCYKEDTIQQKAKKAFYAVWTNWIFINPTTENLRDLKLEDYAIIKKLSYGAKNRLQSYVSYHLNKDHYDMNFDNLNEGQSYSVIRMCEEVFEDTKIMVDWWRNPIENLSITGEDWFKECKEKFQRKKHIERIGLSFINMETKRFLIVDEKGISWTVNQKEATRFNVRDLKTKDIFDQELDSNKEKVRNEIQKLVGIKTLKMFHQTREKSANDLFLEV